MAKHTEGPWLDDKYGQLRSPSGKPIDVQRLGVCLITNGDEYPEARANARLISAAPDLLSACERLEWALHLALQGKPVINADETFAEARSAIAKALGETDED